MKTTRELKGDLTKGTILTLVLLVSVLFIGIVSISASTQDQIREQIQPIKVSDEVCSSFMYKSFYKNYLDGFSVEVLVPDDSKEHFYVVLKEDNCAWDYTFYDSYTKRPDVTLSGSLDNREEITIKANTFRGWVIKNRVEKEIL